MFEDRSTSPDSIEMLGVAQKLGVELAWDRYAAQLPQCGFGETGLCCRHCLQGPCRIDPFGNGPQTGVCGATADTIVARGLDRSIAGGTAAPSGHAKHLAHTLKKVAEGKAPARRGRTVRRGNWPQECRSRWRCQRPCGGVLADPGARRYSRSP